MRLILSNLSNSMSKPVKAEDVPWFKPFQWRDSFANNADTNQSAPSYGVPKGSNVCFLFEQEIASGLRISCLPMPL